MAPCKCFTFYRRHANSYLLGQNRRRGVPSLTSSRKFPPGPPAVGRPVRPRQRARPRRALSSLRASRSLANGRIGGTGPRGNLLKRPETGAGRAAAGRLPPIGRSPARSGAAVGRRSGASARTIGRKLLKRLKTDSETTRDAGLRLSRRDSRSDRCARAPEAVARRRRPRPPSRARWDRAQHYEKIEIGKGLALQRVGMDLGSAPRARRWGALSASCCVLPENRPSLGFPRANA